MLERQVFFVVRSSLSPRTGQIYLFRCDCTVTTDGAIPTFGHYHPTEFSEDIQNWRFPA
jgi:hypothetical protein